MENNAENRQRWVSEPIRLARAETAERMAGYTGIKRFGYLLLHSLIGEILVFLLVQYLVLFCMWRAMLFDILDFAGDVFLIDPNGTGGMAIQFYSMLLVVMVIVLYVVFLERRSAASMGFRKRWWILKYIGGAVYGFAAFAAALALTLVLCGGRVQIVEDIPVRAVLIALGGFLIQGAEEEVLYRGFFLTTMARNHHLILPVLITSSGFALMHVGNPGVNTTALLNIALVGVFLALLFLRTESLWTCCAWHSIWNFVQGNFFGLPVSGLDAGGSVLTTQIRQGRDLFSGGEFGVEASVCATVVLIVLIVIESFLLSGKYRKYADALEDEEEYQAFMRENGNPEAVSGVSAADAATDTEQDKIKEISLEDDIPDMPTGWQPSVTPSEPDAVLSADTESGAANGGSGQPDADADTDTDTDTGRDTDTESGAAETREKTMSVLKPFVESESEAEPDSEPEPEEEPGLESEPETETEPDTDTDTDTDTGTEPETETETDADTDSDAGDGDGFQAPSEPDDTAGVKDTEENKAGEKNTGSAEGERGEYDNEDEKETVML